MTPKKYAQDLYDKYYYFLYELSSYPIPKDIKSQAKACTMTDIKNTLKSLNNIKDDNAFLFREQDNLVESLNHIEEL
tara:strand:+ start:243 stop:473 length:231 start_codon:yes stop_codon:yes gene_type:complete